MVKPFEQFYEKHKRTNKESFALDKKLLDEVLREAKDVRKLAKLIIKMPNKYTISCIITKE